MEVVGIVEAIIERVSIPKRGVKIDGKWYNWLAEAPLPKAGDRLNLVLVGKTVTAAEPSERRGSDAYPQQSGEDRRQRLIVRQSCLQRAVDLELGGKLYAVGGEWLPESKSPDGNSTIRKRIEAAAEAFEAWVMR